VRDECLEVDLELALLAISALAIAGLAEQGQPDLDPLTACSAGRQAYSILRAGLRPGRLGELFGSPFENGSGLTCRDAAVPRGDFSSFSILPLLLNSRPSCSANRSSVLKKPTPKLRVFLNISS